MKRTVRWFTPLVLIALLLAGCGASSRQSVGAQRSSVQRLLTLHLGDQGQVTPSLAAHDHRASHSLAPRGFHQHFVIERLDIPKDPALAPSPSLLAASAHILSTTIAHQHVVIIFPRHSRHRAILFEHGSGETADLDVDVAPSAPTILALVRAGYTWAESDAGFNNWGDRSSLRDDVAVARWLRAHGDPIIDIGGDSMGGLDATQLIPLVHPQAVFELFPVCDERTIMGEFGLLMHRADAPLKRLSPVAMQDVRGLPMLFTASPQDTVVPKISNADVCTREARAAGASVREVTTKGEHGNSSNWRASRLITFLDRAAGAPRSAAGDRDRLHRRWRQQARLHHRRHLSGPADISAQTV